MDNNDYKGSRILLVEDEETLAIGLEYNLQEEGYSVVRADDGRKALEYFRSYSFDLIVLDIMLPYYNGFEVARSIREKSPRLPILMLTARTEHKDRVLGLELGADDYLTKPFHLQELLARIKGMLRRKTWYNEASNVTPIYYFGNNEVNFDDLSCRSGARQFCLTSHEAMVLKYLVVNKGRIVSRKELLDKVWNVSTEMETRTVDNFIMRLRKYFEPDPSNPIFIKSVRIAGYIFTS
ncbi:response regulator transcription factor [bacterium]|nr:response regulator transcription factor [bacterium]